MSTVSSRPGPTLIFLAASTSRSTSLSLTDGALITRDVAVQRCPVDPKAPP
jgi:hypothetical protein